MNPLLKLQEDAESNRDQRTKQWHKKLVGKTLVEDRKETDLADHQVFPIKELPQPNRVLKDNSMMTMDYRPERLNVRIDDSNKVIGVHFS